jgi:hypothetical protein
MDINVLKKMITRIIPLCLLFLLAITPSYFAQTKALEIHSGMFQWPGDPDSRPAQFIKSEGSLILLPQRSSYREIVSNSQKTIFAINYHETSNFDSVDLVISYDGRVFPIPNLWLYLEGKLKAQRTIPNIGFDRSYLSVKSVDNNTLSCSLIAFNNQSPQPTDIHFTVAVDVDESRIDFRLEGQ